MAIAKSSDNDFNKIYLKATSFCAYQERTQQEVRDKLYEQGVDKDMTEEVITRLIIDNFLNEERFAKAYAGGKFRMKKWGRLKIELQLKSKGVSNYCIRKGMAEIGDDDYAKVIRDLIEKKSSEENEKNIFKKKHKVSNFLIRKGFEPELVWDILNNYFDE